MTISEQEKAAWEYRAYEAWTMNYGSPAEKAAELRSRPRKAFGAYFGHAKYFEDVQGKRVVNVCGSNGRKAVPLALMGADVTVFDISEENRRYALELAKCAGVSIEYEVCDFNEVDLHKYGNTFNIAYAEGGILHYFHDLPRFFGALYAILKPEALLVLGDFHPFRKLVPFDMGNGVVGEPGDYFDSSAVVGKTPLAAFFPEEQQGDFPEMPLRVYNLSEIINAVIGAGFTLREFNETPHWVNPKIPAAFTIAATK